MINAEDFNSMKLIQQAEEIGLLNSYLTVKCISCKAIFPKEYDKCPQCNFNRTS